MMRQKEIFKIILKAIDKILAEKERPVRIAINGIEGTGKTTFAQELVDFFYSTGCNALHISIDGFHFNKEHRYRLGRDSALGYYEDAYNEEGFIKNVLLSSQKTSPEIVTGLISLTIGIQSKSCHSLHLNLSIPYHYSFPPKYLQFISIFD